MKRLIAGAILLAVGSAHAAYSVSQFPPNPGVLPGGGWEFTPGTTFGDPPPPRSWTNGVYGGVKSFVATDAISLAGKGGPLAVSVAQSISLRNGAIAVAKCIVGANVWCAAGTAAAIAYEAYRVKHPSQVPGSSVGVGFLDFDPGTTTTSQSGWSTSMPGSGGSISGTSKSAIAATAAKNAQTYWRGAGYPSCEIYVASVGATTWNSGSNTCGGNGWHTNIFTATTVSACPASIDALNPAYSIPAGSPVGVDGKCPTAGYNHQPYTPDQAGGLVDANPPTLPNSNWGNGVKDAIDKGGQSAPATPVTSGPASQTGTPVTENTTVQGPNGTTTIQKTTTPTYNYTYNGPTVTIGPTTTTTVTVDNSTNTTTTTTSTVNNPAPGSQDPLDPCTANPGRAGCSALGTPAAAETIPNQNIPVVFTPVTFGGSASCPAPLTYSVFGKTYELSYDPLCNLLASLSPLFLFTGAAAAALIFMEGLKA